MADNINLKNVLVTCEMKNDVLHLEYFLKTCQFLALQAPDDMTTSSQAKEQKFPKY